MERCGEESNREIQRLIAKHQLAPHPEGGWYRRTFISNDLVLAQDKAACRYEGVRAAGSSILYLLSAADFSAWHSVQSDETWYFHGGEPLSLWVLHSENGLEEVCLGPELLQYTIRAGTVFAAQSQGAYSLLGCAVTPGFDFKDFHLMDEDTFVLHYPQHQSLKKWIHPTLRNLDK